MTFDPYATLGLDRAADADLIKQAYRRLSKKWHPDRNPGDEVAKNKFEQVGRAFLLLSDPARRAAYDATGNADEQRPGPAGDPAEAELLQTIGQFLLHELQQVLASPFSKGVETVDLADRVRKTLRENKAQAEKVLRDGEKGLKAMRTALERFSVPEGVPNHPATVLGARIRSLGAELDKVRADVARFQRTLEYMAGVRYRRDDGSASMSSSGAKMIAFGWTP